MKIVINNDWGSFDFPQEWYDNKKVDELKDKDYKYIRTMPELISFVESPDYQTEDFTSLKVVKIPHNVSDWLIVDYDGVEEIIYVLNGKLYVVQ